MKRSVVQTGSSLAVTLPMEVVQAFGLRKGQEVDVSVHPLTGAVTIRPGLAWFEEGRVNERFRAAADLVLERRASVLRQVER